MQSLLDAPCLNHQVKFHRLILTKREPPPEVNVDSESDAASFGAGMRRRILEDFAVSYYNGSIKPNLAERNPTTGRDAEFLMDAPQFGKIKREDVWASSSAVGTGYQYRVVYKDKRYSDLDRLLRMYSGNVSLEENDRAWVEQSLY